MTKPVANIFERAMNSFERAVDEKAFEGSIPYLSEDEEEQRALDAAHRRIQRNYTKARNRLFRLYVEARGGKCR